MLADLDASRCPAGLEPPGSGSAGLGHAACRVVRAVRLGDLLRGTPAPEGTRCSGPVVGWSQLEALELEGGGDRAPDEAVEAEGSGLLPLAGRDHHLGFLAVF